MSKKYGLTVPGRKGESSAPPKANFTKPSVFGSDSDSEDSAPVRKISAAVQPGANEKRQAKRIQEKALEEDPTIFQYDELYDEIESKRDQQKADKNKEIKQPKYIKHLLQCAERRKIENERRLERMIQKERELEGEQFKDKESFVTAAYRKKLEELRKAEEREKREEYLEAIGDVTKQQNLDGFYRHLYEQKLGKDTMNKNEKSAEIDVLEKESVTENATEPSSTIKSTKLRTYRKRRSSNEAENEDSSTVEKDTVKKAHIQSNLDADSDFSIDSSSESENESPDKNPTPPINNQEVTIKTEPKDVKEEKKDDHDKMDVNIKEKVKDENAAKKTIQQPVDEDVVEKKPEIKKIDIWKKRTVGNVFEEALKRYYERKAIRNG